MSNINWYPGHMKKTKDMILENLKAVDLVIEILDARIPNSSRNPDISSWVKNKYKIMLLNKMDLAHNKTLEEYKSYFIDNNLADEVIDISVEKGTNISLLKDKIQKIYLKKLEKVKKKGLIKTQIRAMVIGIPNVGKSKFINKMAKKSKAKVGNLPGFTRGKQWIRVNDNFELLDTPGILWPKFDDQNVAMNLAITGAIKDNVLKQEDVCNGLLNKLKKYGQIENINQAYDLEIENIKDVDNYIIMDKVLERFKITKKNEYDYQDISSKILRDFRSLKIGKCILELPEERE